MDSSFFLTMCAAATCVFTLLVTLLFIQNRKLRLLENHETEVNSSSLSLLPPFSMPRNRRHHVFPSFHGADVRKSFLGHFLKECKSKGIDPFLDNDITRGEFIGPELKKAIKGSRIAIVLLSKRYASSSWCLDELVEIMKCNEDLGYTVMVIFYEVDPSDVKKQAGDFGKVFKKTCKGKKEDVIRSWSQALAQVATLAGYHSTNSKTDAEMIETITTDVSNKLFSSTRSRELDAFPGMEAHMEKMDQALNLGQPGQEDEVRMIGIWGPAGIGKTTIARCMFNKHSGSFDLSVFMTNVKAMYTAPVCSDDYIVKLDLQQKFLSQIINQKEAFKISHLGAAEERLNDKRVLVVLDNVDQLVQLEAMAKETWWFGHGSRIIITSQNQNLLKAHGINHIYKVNLPTKSLEIFCMYAFKQKTPPAGFERLAWEVTVLAGQLPLALRVIGSCFWGKTKEQWEDALPELRSSLKGEIESILKFSYDALSEKEKKMFLHLTTGIITSFTSNEVKKLKDYLANTFTGFQQGLDALVDKALISINGSGHVTINDVVVKLGREIVRKKYGGSEPRIREPGKRMFLDDASEICQVLSNDTTGGGSLIGISLDLSETYGKLYISERAFERMPNLQFLSVYGDCDGLYFPQCLNSMSQKFIGLSWDHFPMQWFPPDFITEFLVYLNLPMSKLQKLWDGTKPLSRLKKVILSDSVNLKQLPDLSTATNLQLLELDGCSSLLELPSSVGNATNLQQLYLNGCLGLLKLPCSIGNATNLKLLELNNCSSLVTLPSSIGNLHNLWKLLMEGCSNLQVLPININMKSLSRLYLSNCPMLKTFPEISTNIKILMLNGSPVQEVPLAVGSWSRLEELHMSYWENLSDLPHALNTITDLEFTNKEIKELVPWIKGLSRLRRLVLTGFKKLVSLPELPHSLLFLEAQDCDSLERLDCSFRNPDIRLNFSNCFKLNQEARDRIIQGSNFNVAVLPGGEVPAYFSDRATGGTLTVKLNERPLHKSLRFKGCIALDFKGEDVYPGRVFMYVSYRIMDKQNGPIVPCRRGHHPLPPAVSGHLYTFELEADVTSNELCFEFLVSNPPLFLWSVKECGVVQLL